MAAEIEVAAALRAETASLKRALQEMGGRLDDAIRMLSIISNLTGIPARSAKPEQGAGAILDVLVRNVVDLDKCSLMAYDSPTGKLKLMSAKGQTDLFGEPEAPYNLGLSFQCGEGIAGLAFERNEPLFWDPSSPDYEKLKREPGLGNPVSLASLPLTTLGKKVGVLNISFCQAEPFTPYRRNDLILLSGVVANVMQTFWLKAEVDDYAASLVDRVLASQEQYRRLFEDSLLGIFRVTTQGELITANPAFAGIFGYQSPHQMLAEVNDLSRDLCVEAPQAGEALAKIVSSQGPVQQEVAFRRRDGSHFLGRLAAWSVTDSAGRLHHLEGFLEDLSDRRRAEGQVADSQALTRSLVDLNPLACLITDSGGKVTRINKKALEILGLDGEGDSEELDLLSWEPWRGAGLGDDLAACLKEGRGSSVVREFGGLEGAPLSLRLHLSPLLDAGGKCLGAHCLLEPESAGSEG